MSTLEVLRAARELISDPARWAQDYWAETVKGFRTEPTDASAVRWCAAGAVNKVTGGPNQAAIEILESVLWDAGYRPPCIATLLFDFNDHRTHAEVLTLFDRAIARLESEAAPC
jgi:hypothetical protein